MQRYSFKVCLLGDAAVGKTSLVKRFVIDAFDDEYITTIGTKVSKKELVLSHPSDPAQKFEVVLTIWDIVGQPGLHTLRSMYYTGADGALVVGDLSRVETFDTIANWVAGIFGRAGRIPVLLLANKSDLPDDQKLDTGQVQAYADTVKAPFLLTSAKLGTNVERSFEHLAKRMLQRSLEATIAAPVEVLDSMVADFCSLMGGLEAGMEPFKQACEEAKISFHQPSKEQLDALNSILKRTIATQLDATRAKTFYTKHANIIRKC